MNNNYIGTSMLDEILSRRKELAIKMLKRQLIVCGIAGIIMTIACITMTSEIADFFACWILPAIFAGCYLHNYNYALRTKERIKNALSLRSDDELEDILQKSENLNEYAYLSDVCIIDFNLGRATKLSEIITVNKLMQMDVKGKAIMIFRKAGRSYAIYFKTNQQRAEAIEKINEAISRSI